MPLIVAGAGDRASERFVEFFTAHIRNRNTRAAYARAVSRFFSWCDTFGLTLEAIRPVHVAAYIEQHPGSKPTVKQALAAIRMLFDWLVVGQVVPANPAAAVRGPRYVAKQGKTPVLGAEEARMLLDGIDISTAAGLRDRALIGLMCYTFARVGAVVAMRVEDYYPSGKRWWVRLHEKGGKHHELPAHHALEGYLDAYIEATGIAAEPRSFLFRSIRGGVRLSDRPLSRTDVLRMIKRRAREHHLPPRPATTPSARRASPPTSGTAAASRTPSGSPPTSPPARRSSTIVPGIASRSRRSSGSGSDPGGVAWAGTRREPVPGRRPSAGRVRRPASFPAQDPGPGESTLCDEAHARVRVEQGIAEPVGAAEPLQRAGRPVADPRVSVGQGAGERPGRTLSSVPRPADRPGRLAADPGLPVRDKRDQDRDGARVSELAEGQGDRVPHRPGGARGERSQCGWVGHRRRSAHAERMHGGLPHGLGRVLEGTDQRRHDRPDRTKASGRGPSAAAPRTSGSGFRSPSRKIGTQSIAGGGAMPGVSFRGGCARLNPTGARRPPRGRRPSGSS